MWKALERYKALDPEARKLFRRAATLLPVIVVSLRIRGFKKTKEGLQTQVARSSTPEMAEKQATEAVQKTCRMVRAAAHYGIVRATCLEQSLALWHLLGTQNIPSSLRIGVRKQTEKFEAHAWVEYKGQAVSQAEEVHKHYEAFESEFSELPGAEP
jgi:Transglutaminase-like superfamily